MYTDVDRRLAGDMPRKHDACVRWSFRSMELVVCSYILYAWQWLCMLLRRPLTYLWPADSQTPQYELPGTDSFEWRCLCSLNTRRAQHDSAPLQWSGELAEMAQQWAGSIAQKGFLQYSETKDIGETLSMVTQSAETETMADNVITGWYDESRHFDFSKPRWNRKATNFTQLVWKSTTECGVGKAATHNGKRIAVVVFYRPAGNLNSAGQYDANVRPPCDEDGGATSCRKRETHV